MAIVKALRSLRQRGLYLAKLFEDASEKVVKVLLILTAKVAVDVCNADSRVTVMLIDKIVYHGRCKNRLAGSRNSRAEERLLVGF